jgi:deoxyribodipyrimidine photolyase-related protein
MLSDSVNLIFPHQLFAKSPLPAGAVHYLIEEFLFFRQFKFHKLKIAFHRGTMRAYAEQLQQEGRNVVYIDAQDERHDVRHLIAWLASKGVRSIASVDPTDNWLERRIGLACKAEQMDLQWYENPQFLNRRAEMRQWLESRRSLRQTDFYIAQRRQRQLLLTQEGKPQGGKWTFDSENRRKYPRRQSPPGYMQPPFSPWHEEAYNYCEKYFGSNYGELNRTFIYPVTHAQAQQWLNDFLEQRFAGFGPYEDALVQQAELLHHSLLSPLLNVGLLTPGEVVAAAMRSAATNSIPLNSVEGFIRQLIGWREFIRGVYEMHGSKQRNKNFWQFTHPLPDSFWRGSTGILPVDSCIDKVKKNAYNHHIERLMVLGNFMLLCEIDPAAVYTWFMTYYIDAYDWVMVPNVYGMSQFADGGIFASKPYISGSNYLRKMSDYPSGDWQQTWDALFWRFLFEQGEFFSRQPRLNMLLQTFRRRSPEEQQRLLKYGETYLKKLHATAATSEL